MPKVILVMTSWQNLDLDPDLTPELYWCQGQYWSQGRPPRQSKAVFSENRRKLERFSDKATTPLLGSLGKNTGVYRFVGEADVTPDKSALQMCHTCSGGDMCAIQKAKRRHV